MSEVNSNAEKLGTEKVGRLLLNYSIPSIIGMVVVSLYSIVDSVFIGRGVGPLAIAGLALTFPIMNLIAAIGTLVGIGASTRTSIALGRRNMSRARNILGNAVVLTFIMSALLIIPSLIYLDEILVLFGGSDQTIPYARDYLRIVIPGSVFTNLTYSFSGIMRASGYPQKSMFALILGVVLNVILDPIFIFALDMGIEGAAWATIISMFVSSVFVFTHFMDNKSYVHLEKGSFRLKRSIIINIISIGISPFLMNAAASLVNIIMNTRLVDHGGDLAIGAYGIVSRYGIFFVMCVMGLCQGMQPIMGYNYGARKIKRMKDTLKLTIRTAVIITTTGFLIFELFPGALTRVFTDDPELIEMSKEAMRIVFLVFPLVGFQIVVSNFYQSVGKARQSIFMSLTRQILFLTPLLYLFSSMWGLKGAWLSMPVSDLLAFVTAVFFLVHAKNIFYPKRRTA